VLRPGGPVETDLKYGFIGVSDCAVGSHGNDGDAHIDAERRQVDESEEMHHSY